MSNLWSKWCQETNRYAHQLKESATIPGKLAKWTETTVNEIYTFLAAVILMGLVRKNSLKDYWSTDPVIRTPFFSALLSLDRFQLLQRALHFADNATANLRDPLNKIRSIFTSLMTGFGQMFIPHRDLCIDESLLLWKGWLGFRQYIPSKRKRFGIKLFMLCDVLTGYIINVVVYTGSSTDITHSRLGVSGSVVLTLLKPYLGRGHTLYVDNWYTSPSLFNHLLRACGTVRANRKGIPRFRDGMSSGEADFKSCEEMLAMKWHDKRDVHMLTTVNSAEMSPSGKIYHTTGNEKIKPQCVLDYIKKMGGVDKVDMMDSFVGCTRKTLKWYKKLFFHFVDLAVHNAFIVYKVKNDSSLTYQKFCKNLVRQLVEEHHTPQKPSSGDRPPAYNPLHLTARHFPSEIPVTVQTGEEHTQVLQGLSDHQKVPTEKAEDEVHVQTLQHSAVSNRVI
ncbi:piggyBac transposable element-derived protein 4-like [Cyprinus carpio]|uniref:PiggyBac transposable element-derived protein 4-like n=1 Tax=Cyprinus carpio TaxID=7962 RepID=A0A9Q9W8H4_CYPCA|nr:piggyBac transposable element-derived protein 4-like [Cyprinus carpio]